MKKIVNLDTKAALLMNDQDSYNLKALGKFLSKMLFHQSWL